MKRLLLILPLIGIITVSCTKKDIPEDELIPIEKGTALTGTAAHISCRNAEISGKLQLSSNSVRDPKFGIKYFNSSGFEAMKDAHSFDSEYNYSITTDILEPETTYYYQSYLISPGGISFSDVNSFETLAVSSMIQTLDATDINLDNAVLNASLDLTDCIYDGLEYGFEVTPDGGTTYTVKATNFSEKNYSAKDESLKPNTKYSFAAYVILDGITYKGESKEFTTTDIQVSITAELSKLSYYEATIIGCLTVKSEGTFTKSARLYYSSTASTLEDLKSSGTERRLSISTTDGSYVALLRDLVSGTQYNYVVVFKVDDSEFVTTVNSFTTTAIQASVTAELSEVSVRSAKISGNVTVESEVYISGLATLYYSSTANTLNSLKSSGTKKNFSYKTDGSFSIDIEALERGKKYYFAVVCKIGDTEFYLVDSFITMNPSCPSGAVDLGLSVCWASCNLGAAKPEDYGGYYQWAGLEDVTDTGIYLKYYCPYHNTEASINSGWTKYVTWEDSVLWSGSGSPDGKTVLDPEDDVAHVKLGGSWRMPTREDFLELKLASNCDWTWTVVNGELGYKVTSRKPGYTDKSIFLPAAGWRIENEFDRFDEFNNTYFGGYWSSSCDGNYASLLIIKREEIHIPQCYRYYGLSVRPVSE